MAVNRQRLIGNLFGTYTFRFMISYVTSLAFAVFILLSITFAFFSYDFFNSVNASLESELDELEQQYLSSGADSIDSFVEQRASENKFSRFAFILVNQQQEKIAGDLLFWPDYKVWSDGWLSFEMSFQTYNNNTQVYNFLARERQLDGGYKLLVARFSDDVRRNIQLVAGAIIWGMVIMILLGLLGGLITSLMTLHRVEVINDTIYDIMEGNFTHRIPVKEPLDDFQRLAMGINNMLDRIEGAMNDVRDVSNSIAHDLRTPLTRLRNNLSSLEKRSAPQNTEMVREMLEEADNLLSTFSALLRIAQVESGAKRANFSPLDMSKIVDDVVELYEPLAADKHQTLKLDCEKGLHLVGDKDLLFQMLANLMDNAIKYTPAGLGIQVNLKQSLSRHGRWAELEVIDSGPGIPKDKREKVFQRFYRVDESRGLSPGNGLGLALVKAVAKLHHGEIFLSDKALYASAEKGLRVSVKLRLKDLC